jgi:hypothetical protein
MIICKQPQVWSELILEFIMFYCSKSKELNITGRMCNDYSDRAYRMANHNYGDNGSHILIMAVMTAAQLN